MTIATFIKTIILLLVVFLVIGFIVSMVNSPDGFKQIVGWVTFGLLMLWYIDIQTSDPRFKKR